MSEHGIELLTAGELLVRLAEQVPHKMPAAHELTVTYSPKSATDVLANLEAIVGDHAADAIES